MLCKWKSLRAPRSIASNHITRSKSQKGRKKLSLRKEDFIVKKFSKKEFSLASDASKWAKENFEIGVSDQTIRRTLKKHGLKSYSRQKKPCLSAKNTRDRLDFSKNHRTWDYFDWKKVIFPVNQNSTCTGQMAGKKCGAEKRTC